MSTKSQNRKDDKDDVQNHVQWNNNFKENNSKQLIKH